MMFFPKLFRRSPSPPPVPEEATAATPLPLRRMEIDGQVLEYRLQRSQRVSIGFLINDQGLRVSAPLRASIAAIESAILSKQRWIFSKLALRAEIAKVKPQTEFVWQDGAQLPFMGHTLTLRVQLGKAMPALLDSAKNELILSFAREATPEKIRQRCHTWLHTYAEQDFLRRLQQLSQQMGVNYASLTLSNARTKWGSCSSSGRIHLNWRLIHFHPNLIDYVVIHELAHRKEMNHSPRFWAIVGAHFPHYKEARAQLQKSSRLLPPGV